MPLTRINQPKFRENEKEAPTIVVPFGTTKNVRTVAFWTQEMDRTSYQETLQTLQREWPEALDVVPCLIEKEEVRQGSNDEVRLERAYRKIATAIARNIDKYMRYSPEYKKDALEDLRDEIEQAKPLWKAYQCKKGSERLGVH